MLSLGYSDTSSKVDTSMEEGENKMDKNDEVIDIGSSFFGVLMCDDSSLSDDGMHEKVVDMLSVDVSCKKACENGAICESECVEENVCINGFGDNMEDAYGCCQNGDGDKNNSSPVVLHEEEGELMEVQV
eukprot:c29373_g1_i4 orf=57-446(+)